jgi:hypothetical protein
MGGTEEGIVAGTSWEGECWKLPGLRPRKMRRGDILDITKLKVSSIFTMSDRTRRKYC